MTNSEEKKYQRRAAIGTGASIGVAVGAVIAAIVSNNESLNVIIGSTIGGVVGGLIGTRLKSQAFQFLWIEYPAKVGKQMLVGVAAFLIPFWLYAYSIKEEANLAIKIILLFASTIGITIFTKKLADVISDVDDVLKEILTESFAVAFAIGWILLLFMGMLNMAVEIPGNWFFSPIILGFSGLIGRLIIAWKYR
jgi:hypothetical protein